MKKKYTHLLCVFVCAVCTRMHVCGYAIRWTEERMGKHNNHVARISLAAAQHKHLFHFIYYNFINTDKHSIVSIGRRHTKNKTNIQIGSQFAPRRTVRCARSILFMLSSLEHCVDVCAANRIIRLSFVQVIVILYCGLHS